MPIFEGGGVRLFYEENGGGQPIVFVHGTISDYRTWSAQTESLSSGFRTIAYSRRYARPNEREGDVMDSTVQNNSADLESLIRGLGLDRAHVVGHSYGGFIAMYFASQHPELLRSLTLINPVVMSMLAKEASTSAALSLLLRSPGVALSARRAITATNVTSRAVDGGDRSAVERIFIPALQNGRTDLPAKPPGFWEMVADNARTLREATAPYPPLTAHEAKGIRTPTLVVWGELSAPWDSRISEMLSTSIPDCEGAKIAGTGHFCKIERPSEVNERIRAFLLKHS